MPLEYEELRRQALAQAQGAGRGIAGGSFQPPQDEDLSLLEQAGDVLMAPLRGLEGAAQDIYGLADTLALDALPDYEERVFGESRTGLGGLIEGVSTFAAGFYAAGFVPLGWTAKLGRLAPVARGLVKGAITDFAVFDGHEERLSNLLQAFPALQNPVSEFLAADESDSELEGRFKNALEGVGIGAVTELGLLAFKGMRAARKARLAGLDPEAVEKAVDKAAPPEAVEAAWRKMDEQAHGPEPLPAQTGEPSMPAAADAVDPSTVQAVPPPPPAPTGAEAVLRTMVSEENARAILDRAAVREAPFSHATLLERDPLDPRVAPRRLTEQERLAQGMLQTDLNLSGYQGPDGALQLMRAMEQTFLPIREVGDASRKTLNQIETENLKNLADLTGYGPQHLLAAAQRDATTIAEINSRFIGYKVALQSNAAYARRLADAALKGTDDKAVLEALVALETQADLRLAVGSILGEQGRGLGANRIRTPFIADLFDREAVEAALHERGGRQKALDVLRKVRGLVDPDPLKSAARLTDFASGGFGRKWFGVLNEYWYNSLLGRPTTPVVNGLSNALTTVARPLELIAGGLLTGKTGIVQDGVRELQALITSAEESYRAAAAALRGEGQVLDPRSLLSDINDPARKAITAATFGAQADTIHGQALEWFGKLVRMPSAALTATDQFFQQLNYRAVARAQLTKEALAKGLDPAQAALAATAEMDKLIFRGQAYGTAQLYHRGVEDAMRSGLRAKVDVDRHAAEFVRNALASPEHARLSSLAEVAGRRAQEATFTTPLRPGSLPYRVQEAVTNHWYLRLVMPFVRTPVNVIGFAADRSVRGVWGAAQLLAAKRFPSLASALEESKNSLVRDVLSGNPRLRADAAGRLALGMSTTALFVTKAAEVAEDGLPLITGRGPSDKEQRQILEDAGWQPYSIRVGKEYVAYGRLDPFASIIGTAADIVNYIKYAPPEDQDLVENLSYGLAVAVANNLVNKTYLSGLAGFADMLHDPARGFAPWARTLGASFVPGQAAAAVNVVDPLLRDVRSLADAARARWPGASDDLPPLRNVLGEPVRRAQSLGSGASSVTNAFVPVLYREVSDDLVRKELVKLQHGFTPPKRTRGGLDLSTVRKGGDGQNAFDRWLELHGQVKIGGVTMRTALRKLFTSTAYKRIPAESTAEVGTPRIAMVQDVIDDYRAAAYRQLVREYPELAAADRARVAQKAALVRGQETRPPLLQALQGNR